MNFALPQSSRRFEIPSEWWEFAEMPAFVAVTPYFPYEQHGPVPVIAEISSVEPPERSPGVAPFKKYKLVPILLAFHSPECALPPVKVTALNGSPYRYRVTNGYHRFYASVAVGFTHVPVLVHAEGGANGL